MVGKEKRTKRLQEPDHRLEAKGGRKRMGVGTNMCKRKPTEKGTVKSSRSGVTAQPNNSAWLRYNWRKMEKHSTRRKDGGGSKGSGRANGYKIKGNL